MKRVHKVKNLRNPYFPEVSFSLPFRLGAYVLAVAVTAACGRLPAGMGVPPTTWVMPPYGAVAPATGEHDSATLILLDSVSLRPLLSSASPGTLPAATLSGPTGPSAIRPGRAGRVALVTTFQGSRFHPETVRALAADSQALGATAGSIAALTKSRASDILIIDFQGMTPADIRGLIEVSRAVADSARAYVLAPIGFVVPAADTAGYPGALVARTANLIVVRLDGEHRPGTSPGPFASAQWLTRHLGARAAEVGASRVVGELPMGGYRWAADGTATRITCQQARAAVLGDGIALSRDPASRALHAASPRGGWEILSLIHI